MVWLKVSSSQISSENKIIICGLLILYLAIFASTFQSKVFLVQDYQDRGFSQPRFFQVQVYQDPDFSGSWSRVWVQVLKAVQNSNQKNLSDNRNLWKVIKLYFSYKGLKSNKLILERKGKSLIKRLVFSITMSNLFRSITKELVLKEDCGSITGTLKDVLQMLCCHSSIEKELGKQLKSTIKLSFYK